MRFGRAPAPARLLDARRGDEPRRDGATGPPATLMTKSGVPTSAESFSMWSASVRSATIRSPLWWMSVAKTWTPSRASLLRTASPIPLAAPVTSAFLPRSPSSGIGGAVDVDRHARQVGRVVGAERDDQRRGLGDCADAAHVDLFQGTFRSLVTTEFQNLLQSSARDDPWRDTIHAHS